MSPEEDRTRDAVDSELKHYQLSYSGPPLNDDFSLFFDYAFDVYRAISGVRKALKRKSITHTNCIIYHSVYMQIREHIDAHIAHLRPILFYTYDCTYTWLYIYSHTYKRDY